MKRNEKKRKEMKRSEKKWKEIRERKLEYSNAIARLLQR